MIASGLLLGSVTMAMLIGHWYLVNPGLDINWLKGACLAFGGSLLLKVITIVVSLLIGMLSDPFGPQSFFDKHAGAVFIFVIRLIVGVIIPAAFCFMAYRAAAIRSTQSSTGILYPSMIVVFIGEMVGTFLTIGFSGLSM